MKKKNLVKNKALGQGLENSLKGILWKKKWVKKNKQKPPEQKWNRTFWSTKGYKDW